MEVAVALGAALFITGVSAGVARSAGIHPLREFKREWQEKVASEFPWNKRRRTKAQ